MRSILSIALLLFTSHACSQIVSVGDNNPTVSFQKCTNLGVFKNKLVCVLDGNLYQCGPDNKLIKINPPIFGSVLGSDDFRGLYPEVNGKFYFPYKDGADNKLCVWDGVNDPGFVGQHEEAKGIREMVALDDKICFIKHPTTLTSKLAEYDPFIDQFYDLSVADTVSSIVPFHGKLYVISNRLYVFNPNTFTVDVVPGWGTTFENPYQMSDLNNKLYFIAKSTMTNNLALFEYDGGHSVPKLVSGNLKVSGEYQVHFGTIGFYKGEIYFSADTLVNDKNLYKYSPATGALTRIATFNSFQCADNFIVYKDWLLFCVADKDLNMEVWRYDGVNPPVNVADLATGPWGSNPRAFVTANGTIYFNAEGDTNPMLDLYRFEGGLDALELSGGISGVKVYPNPIATTTRLFFDLKEAATISVIVKNIDGREVYKSTYEYLAGACSMQLNLGKLTPGNYAYYLLGDADQVYASGKFVKE